MLLTLVSLAKTWLLLKGYFLDLVVLFKSLFHEMTLKKLIILLNPLTTYSPKVRIRPLLL